MVKFKAGLIPSWAAGYREEPHQAVGNLAGHLELFKKNLHPKGDDHSYPQRADSLSLGTGESHIDFIRESIGIHFTCSTGSIG